MPLYSKQASGAGPAALAIPGETSLAGWYADPLTRDEALALLADARDAQRQCLRDGRPCFAPRLLALVCHHWLGGGHDADYRSLSATTADARSRALLELVMGQLLASGKRTGALDHLQAGFDRAAPLLDAGDYFELVRRHERLAHLAFADRPSPPQGLAALLNEAAVVARLCDGERRIEIQPHRDTVG